MTYFYGQLFAMDTEIRAMLPAAMDIQRRRFFRALLRTVGGQDDLAALVPYLEQLGRAHRKYGVREQHYEVCRNWRPRPPGPTGTSTSAGPTR
jgi:hemoglobin-like flavoprotein